MSDLVSIKDLLENKYDFFIPSYQRGYRWGEFEAKALFDDLNEFFSKSLKDSDYYCMQPIVVAKNDNKYEVIDGQQRLTTFYILAKVLGVEKTYSISYETRDKSEEFLENLNSNSDANNIDFNYMKKVFNFFDSKENKENLNKFGLDKIKVIWYEVESSSLKHNNIDIFNRLNSGKIPLTNAELIKALILKSNNFLNIQNRLEIASSYEYMNIELENDNFWGFISNREYETRVDILFELLLLKNSNDQYIIFRSFYEKLQEEGAIKIWEKVKRIFYTIKHWYEDNELYHIVGFIIAEKILSIQDIYRIALNYNKDEFIQKIKEKIKENLQDNKTHKLDIKNIEYKNLIKAKKVLLLFNIASILQNKNNGIRFNFELFKKEKWSLEHINPQTDKELNSNEKEEIIETILQQDKDKKEELIEITKDSKNINEFLEFAKKYNENFNLSTIDDIEIDNISNLTLLTTSDNSRLSNKLFFQKLNIVKKMDKQGAFVPLCTKNVFLKYYSENQVKQNYLIWDKNNAKDYLDVLNCTIINFLGASNEQ